MEKAEAGRQKRVHVEVSHLDRVDQLAVDVERSHAVLQHPFAHDQHQVVPLALADEVSAAETGAARQQLVERRLLAEVIRCGANHTGSEVTRTDSNTLNLYN